MSSQVRLAASISAGSIVRGTMQTITMLAVLSAFYAVASVEPSQWARFAVFILLAATYAGVMVSVRRRIAASLLFLAGLWVLKFADDMKYAAFAEHIHFIDLIALFEYVKAGDLVIVKQYQGILLQYGAYALLAATAIAAAFRIERRFSPQGQPICSVSVKNAVRGFALVNIIIFVTGNWFWAASNQYVYARMKKAGPTSATHVLSSIADYMRLPSIPHARVVASAAEARSQTGNADCVNCPDIIIVHLESVFDPSIMAAYDGDSMFGHLHPRLFAHNGMLLTRILAGYSFISEFSFNCGVDHRLFGMAGQYPNLFLTPQLTTCGPRHLKRLGYATEVISSVDPRIMRYGAAYSAYGYDEYFAPGTLSIPRNWVQMRDGHFVDAAIERLSRPATQSRLVMLLTVFNHGPHGNWPGIPRTEIYTGPYDRTRTAKDEQESDYINRLNDSLMAFQRLEEFVAARERPTAIIYYGDHQPYFPVTYSEKARRLYGRSVRYVTGYRIAANFQLDVRPGTVPSPLPIEQLFALGLQYVRVSNSAVQSRLKELTADCAADQTTCSPWVKSQLRGILASTN